MVKKRNKQTKKTIYANIDMNSTFHSFDGLGVWVKSYVCKELYKHLFLGNEGGLEEERKSMGSNKVNREGKILDRSEISQEKRFQFPEDTNKFSHYIMTETCGLCW